MNIVDPYIHIVSPVSETPTDTASAAASMVPVVTGIPAGSPVSFAAFSLKTPTTSVDHRRSGRASSEIRSAVRVCDQH